ncbi:unnamed protein product [Heligmosomoides polygyrus]|uniref:SHSP domain-containing protein n=1 Tax=Heligmosomoides polygyrus TaxID=6339 RepID=A0A183GJD1_HELPZ|nr:unnamed protein product [Heligmosomoides polygyrus]
MAASEVDMDINLLNDLANSGIRFARTHSWEDVAEKGASQKVSIRLPAGFRGYDRVATADGNSNMVIYSSLKHRESRQGDSCAKDADPCDANVGEAV